MTHTILHPDEYPTFAVPHKQSTTGTTHDGAAAPATQNGHVLSIKEQHVDAMQVKMLEALTELSKNPHNDVKEKTLYAVDTLLQSSGQTLNSGYDNPIKFEQLNQYLF